MQSPNLWFLFILERKYNIFALFGTQMENDGEMLGMELALAAAEHPPPLQQQSERMAKGMNRTALEILLKMFRQEMANIGGHSPGSSQAAIFLINPMATSVVQQQCPPIQERCDEKPLWNALMGFGFLVLFCLALVGNCLNMLIYSSEHIRFFIAIRMLCTKLLMNTLMMVVMLPQALRVIQVWEAGSPWDRLFWRFWPYQAYLTNVFGFCAMWLTVLMTAECFVHIFMPSKSKLLCTKRALWRSYFFIMITALILASIYPLNRQVSLSRTTRGCGQPRTIVKILASKHPLMQVFEKVHTLADMLLSILLPLGLLVFMTFRIVWRLWVWPNRRFRLQQSTSAFRTISNSLLPGGSERRTTNGSGNSGNGTNSSRGRHFAAEKRGVTRITLITCAIQLVTETPSMSVLIYATMFGPNVHKEAHICIWQTVSYFLCLCNASLSFFVYIAFSTRFRTTLINRFHLVLSHFCPPLVKEAASILSHHGGTGSHQHQHHPHHHHQHVQFPYAYNDFH